MTLVHALRRVNTIQCSFLDISLDDIEPDNNCEAISYTWGAPSSTKPVVCHGHTILFKPNCAQAVLHLHLPTQPRRIWIDAICID